jgi:hypothetical protein
MVGPDHEDALSARCKSVPGSAKGDRPACHVHLRNAVLPFVSSFAREMVDGSRRQQCRRPIKAARPASAEPHRRRRAERNADDMLEDGPITMPADPGARIVADHQGLHERVRSKSGKRRGLLAQRQQPIGDRIGRAEASGVEVVPPAIGGCKAFPEPSVEAERRQFYASMEAINARSSSDVTIASACAKPRRPDRSHKSD